MEDTKDVIQPDAINIVDWLDINDDSSFTLAMAEKLYRQFTAIAERTLEGV